MSYGSECWALREHGDKPGVSEKSIMGEQKNQQK